jgi:hypothetical protein
MRHITLLSSIQAQMLQEEAAGAAAAKAAFYAQQAKAYEEAEERRRFELRVTSPPTVCSTFQEVVMPDVRVHFSRWTYVCI